MYDLGLAVNDLGALGSYSLGRAMLAMRAWF